MFVGPCPLRDTLGADFDNFMEKRAQYDPAGLFVPPLFKAMESRSVGRHYPGCAVHGDCFCQVRGGVEGGMGFVAASPGRPCAAWVEANRVVCRDKKAPEAACFWSH